VYTTQDGAAEGTVITSVIPDIIYQGFVSLGLLPNATEFTNLFSQFRITELEYYIINAQTTDIVEGQSSGFTPTTSIRNTIVYMGKQNDVLSYTNGIQQMQQEEGVILKSFTNDGKPFILKVKKPTFNALAATDTSSTVHGLYSGGWLDCQTATGVDYRGIYIGVQNAYTTFGAPTIAMPVMTVRVKLSLEFRGVR